MNQELKQIRKLALYAWVAFAGIIFLASTVQQAQAGTIDMLAGGVNISVPVKSFKARRFTRVMPQRFDFSCGSAALASLLTFHYGDPVSEMDVFNAMYENGDKVVIGRDGFSLLDMKRFLERRGYTADGFRVPVDKLMENRVPAIALVNHNGYLHFVVIKGVNTEEVLLGDPARGIQVMPREEFEKAWNGIVFVIRSHRDLAARSFNRRGEWHAWVRAPHGDAMSSDSLANFSLLRRPRSDF